MKFEKRNFMGIELDVLVGHPEHDLLFIATQVARSVGLKNPSSAVSSFRSHNGDVKGLIQFREVLTAYHSLGDCKDANGVYQQLIGRPNSSVIQVNSWMGTESWVYQMLMRGDLKAATDFRNWIANEVAPSIRKTGSYNAEDSQNPIALAIMDELKSLRGEIVSLRQELQAKTFSLEAPKAVEVSPYEGQPGVALCDPAAKSPHS